MLTCYDVTRNRKTFNCCLVMLVTVQKFEQALFWSLRRADFDCFCQHRRVYALAVYVTHGSVCSFHKRLLSSQALTQPQHNHKHLSWGRARDRKCDRKTLWHCRVRDYKLNCTLLVDKSTQQLPASDIRGRKILRRRGRQGSLSTIP